MSYKQDKGSPFGGDDRSSMGADVYGIRPDVNSIPDSGRVVARATPLNQVWFDLTQPRRVLPTFVRGRFREWDGDPAKIQDIIFYWQKYTCELLGRDARLDTLKILRGEDFLDVDESKLPKIVEPFFDLLGLASDIRDSDNGLNNPITVQDINGKTFIHTGERRTLAFHMLNMALGDDYAKIPAIPRKADVWSQIAENTKRSDMNAIALARSLANLLMDMYQGEVEFKSMRDMMQANGCDLPYYAQAVDLRVKRGMGERVAQTLGLSKGQVHHYRGLLNLQPDEWTRADDESWTEGFIRRFIDEMPREMRETALRQGWSQDEILQWIKDNSALKKDYKSTTVDLSPETDTEDPQRPPSSQAANLGKTPPQTPPPARYDDFDDDDDWETGRDEFHDMEDAGLLTGDNDPWNYDMQLAEERGAFSGSDFREEPVESATAPPPAPQAHGTPLQGRYLNGRSVYGPEARLIFHILRNSGELLTQSDHTLLTMLEQRPAEFMQWVANKDDPQAVMVGYFDRLQKALEMMLDAFIGDVSHVHGQVLGDG